MNAEDVNFYDEIFNWKNPHGQRIVETDSGYVKVPRICKGSAFKADERRRSQHSQKDDTKRCSTVYNQENGSQGSEINMI